MSPGAPLPWGSVLTVYGWLECFRSDQKARFMDSIWLCQWVHNMSMTWHTAFSLDMWLCCSEACCSQTTQISQRRGHHTTAAPWLQIPPPGNWGSGLNCSLNQPFRQSTEKLGNCHPTLKPGNLMLDLALWNAISKSCPCKPSKVCCWNCWSELRGGPEGWRFSSLRKGSESCGGSAWTREGSGESWELLPVPEVSQLGVLSLLAQPPWLCSVPAAAHGFSWLWRQADKTRQAHNRCCRQSVL